MWLSRPLPLSQSQDPTEYDETPADAAPSYNIHNPALSYDADTLTAYAVWRTLQAMGVSFTVPAQRTLRTREEDR